MTVTFHVPGTPLSKGSMRPIVSKTTGRVFMKPSNPNLKAWESQVATFAYEAWRESLTDGPVWLDAAYVFPRPKCHYGTGRNALILKPAAPLEHTEKPDNDKLDRAVLDALTGIVYADDKQVVGGRSEKFWAGPGRKLGLTVTIRTEREEWQPLDWIHPEIFMAVRKQRNDLLAAAKDVLSGFYDSELQDAVAACEEKP